MSHTPDITEKKYRKLVLLVGTKGFSYVVHDTLNQKVGAVQHIDFSTFPRANKVEDHYWKAFVDHYDLTRDYDEVLVIHNNSLNTFVPKALFDEDFLGSYLQYNAKVFETDFFDYDDIPNTDMNNVYIPYVNINNFLIDQFGPFTYKNTNSILVSRLLEMSKNIDSKGFSCISPNTVSRLSWCKTRNCCCSIPLNTAPKRISCITCFSPPNN